MHNPKISTIEHPKKSANFLSQLLFLWIVPTLYKGSRNGLDKEAITKCLDEDRSEILGDKLELYDLTVALKKAIFVFWCIFSEWKKEIKSANSQNRMPSFRKALFNTFFCCTLVDGLSCLAATLLRWDFRSCARRAFYLIWVTYFRTTIPIILAQILFQFQMTSDTVPLNETSSITYVEQPLGERAFNDNVLYIFSNVYMLSALLPLNVLLVTVAQQHSNLRLRMVGARIRIACCSLIYRKVGNFTFPHV